MLEKQIRALLPSRGIGDAVMALIANRKRILSKGTLPHATFYTGKFDENGEQLRILIGLTEVIIGDTKFKLPKPKKK